MTANHHGPAEEGAEQADPFAPREPTDNRNVGDWRSRYAESEVCKKIRFEACYLAVISVACPLLMVALFVRWLQPNTGIDIKRWDALAYWGYSWLGGMLGGALFSMKWMYHTVARGIWNADRRLWRLFTPLLSAGVAVMVIALSYAGVWPEFGIDVVRSGAGAVGVSLLVGYFADHTISRLAAHAGASKASLPPDDGANS